MNKTKMHTIRKNFRFLSSNAIKLIAAFCMLIDHIGVVFFPYDWSIRIIGRLAMPLFAFFISEGCRYTKDKVRYVAVMFGLGAILSFAFYIFQEIVYLCIFITFALSSINIFALQNLKKHIFNNEKWNKLIPAAMLLVFTVIITVAICQLENVIVDYELWGCLLPVFASLFDFRGINAPEKLKRLDNITARVLCMAVGILIMCIDIVSVNQVAFYGLLAVPILLLYNGKRGKRKMKYFFYVFYPLHLVLLEGIYLLIRFTTFH